MSEESDWHAPGVRTVANAALVSAMVNGGVVRTRGGDADTVSSDVDNSVDSDARKAADIVTSDDVSDGHRIHAHWDYGAMRLRHRAAGNESEVNAAKNAMLGEIGKAHSRDAVEKEVHGLIGCTLDDVEWAPTVEDLFALLDDWYGHSSTVSAFWALLDEDAITLHPCGPLRFRVTHNPLYEGMSVKNGHQ